MDQSLYKNEGVMAQQIAKPEPPLDDQQIKNQQKVHKQIQKYQNKVSEMLKIIQKQKKQNDHLKDQLKTLNDNLNNVISKVGHKNAKNDEANRDDVIRKQLENEIKKNVALQKEVVQLRAKVKIIDGTKITELHNQLKEKQKIIGDMNSMIKTYAKVEKQEKNMDIYRRQEELSHKVSLLNQEVLHLKKKLNQQKKHEEVQQKSLKRQHQQIISLETKYKTTQGTGMSPKKQHETNSSLANENNKLKDNLQSLQSTKKALQKQMKHEIDSCKIKIKILQRELQDTKDMLNKKERQCGILTNRLKDMQRKRDNKTLQPVQLTRKSEDFTVSGIFDQRKQFKGLVHFQGNFRKFDDTLSLTLQKNYKIKKLVFGWFEQHIVSLNCIYELQEGSTKEVQTFKIAHNYQNIKFGQLTFNDFEYIKDIQIYCGKWIQFMRIKTSRDQILDIGSDRNSLKCKRFTFDIRNNEKPIAFLGTIQNKKMFGKEDKEFLISFGLQIKKKQVNGRNSKFGRYPGRTQSLRKHPSKSVFESNKNDKNIIDQQ